jgi:pimeloyl-ACP methyl ester carboxylesterase
VTRGGAAGEELEYLDEGEGPPVVVLHGFGSSPSSWRAILPALTQRMRVIAPDLSPQADGDIASQAEAVRKLLNGIGIDEYAALGHGAGGLVAETLALQGAVRCLVLVDAGPARPDGDTASAADPDPSMLGGLDVPALIVWGEEDPYLSVERAEALAAALPHSTLVLLPGCGHFLPQEAPETVGPLVAEFLRARYLQLPHGHDHAHADEPIPIELGRSAGSRDQA